MPLQEGITPKSAEWLTLTPAGCYVLNVSSKGCQGASVTKIIQRMNARIKQAKTMVTLHPVLICLNIGNSTAVF
jgi:hypothetical protein